jgi:hypothetical protein
VHSFSFGSAIACASGPTKVIGLKLSGPASFSLSFKKNNNKAFYISHLQANFCHLRRVTQTTAVFA